MIEWILGLAGLLLLGSFFGKSKTPPQRRPQVAPSKKRPAESWDDLTLASLDAEIQDLDRRENFPACSSLSPRLIEASTSSDILRKRQAWEAEDGTPTSASEAFKRFAMNPVAFRDAVAERVIAVELAKWAAFFDSVEKQPLTLEQRLAVVTDEDATLVLAGAGSGKTSVITAKAAYLVKAGIRRPEEILLLAFARDAADEISQRISARTGLDVTAGTFHALAYDILGVVEGTKPALAAHATDDKAFFALLRDILQEIIAAANAVAVTLIDWLTGIRLDIKTEWDFQTKHDWYHHVERQNLRTLNGDQVRGFEELTIANWLYVNGIAYEYEPSYEHTLPHVGRKQYNPDFRLTESGVYIEHFGVRRSRGPRGGERLTTSPHVDREDYLAGMAWKRKVHANHGTVLVETYSYDRDEGMLTQRLAERLAPHIELRPRSPQEIYDRVAEMGQV